MLLFFFLRWTVFAFFWLIEELAPDLVEREREMIDQQIERVFTWKNEPIVLIE